MAKPGRPRKSKEDLYKPVTFRLPQSYVNRLESAKWELRMYKTDVIKKALDDLFAKHKIA